MIQIPEDLEIDVTVRQDCPECNSRNSLSITRKVDGTFYHCFDVNCGFSGCVRNGGINPKEAVKYMERQTTIIKSWSIPEWFIPARACKSTLSFIQKYQSLEVYEQGLVDIRYDPQKDRHVFLIWHEGKCYGGHGRSETHSKTGNKKSNKTEPKWYIYGNPLYPIHVGIQSMAVVVEDALSACAVATTKEYTGISLGGTNLKNSYIDSLYKYDELIVALDKDASSKGLDMGVSLRNLGFSVRVVFLKQDLKYNTADEIKEILR